MKKESRILSVALLVLATFSMSCQSPILNHANAQPSPSPSASTSPTAEKTTDEQEPLVKECHLSFPQSGLCASLTWDKNATEEEAGEITLRFWNAKEGTVNGPYVSPTNLVAVKLWMPSMGHGSSPVRVNPVKDASGAEIPGIFKATDVFFMMGGDWEIWIQLKQDKKVIEQAKIDIRI